MFVFVFFKFWSIQIPVVNFVSVPMVLSLNLYCWLRDVSYFQLIILSYSGSLCGSCKYLSFSTYRVPVEFFTLGMFRSPISYFLLSCFPLNFLFTFTFYFCIHTVHMGNILFASVPSNPWLIRFNIHASLLPFFISSLYLAYSFHFFSYLSLPSSLSFFCGLSLPSFFPSSTCPFCYSVPSPLALPSCHSIPFPQDFLSICSFLPFFSGLSQESVVPLVFRLSIPSYILSLPLRPLPNFLPSLFSSLFFLSLFPFFSSLSLSSLLLQHFSPSFSSAARSMAELG